MFFILFVAKSFRFWMGSTVFGILPRVSAVGFLVWYFVRFVDCLCMLGVVLVCFLGSLFVNMSQGKGSGSLVSEGILFVCLFVLLLYVSLLYFLFLL